jgi:biotin carboxyl carrier protein
VPPVVVEPPAEPSGPVRVDGVPTPVRLDRIGPAHAVLAEGDDPARSTRLVLVRGATSGERNRGGGVRREVLLGGWRFEVDVESERRAGLRERASRGGRDATEGGPAEVRAMIPGVVVSVSVVPGDAVAAGQQLLVVEAMKMQNELKAPRDGVVERVVVGTRQTIEVGDLLLVLE